MVAKADFPEPWDFIVVWGIAMPTVALLTNRITDLGIQDFTILKVRPERIVTARGIAVYGCAHDPSRVFSRSHLDILLSCQAPCPDCGTENNAFFGSILSVKVRCSSVILRPGPALHTCVAAHLFIRSPLDAGYLNERDASPHQGEAEMIEAPCSNCGKKSTWYRAKRQVRTAAEDWSKGLDVPAWRWMSEALNTVASLVLTIHTGDSPAGGGEVSALRLGQRTNTLDSFAA